MEKKQNIKQSAPIPMSDMVKGGRGAGLALIILGITITLSTAILVTMAFLIKNEVTKADNARGELALILGKFDEIVELNKKRPIAHVLQGELEKSLPLPIDVPTKVFPLVRALAEQYGLSLEISLGTELPGAIPGGGGYAFSAKAEGTMAALGNFLSVVEGLEITIQIQQWSLSPSEGKYRLAFSGAIFTRGE